MFGSQYALPGCPFRIAMAHRLQLAACEAPLLYFSLGDFVTHPDQPDWGQGQVQSIVGENVTVNFEHAGKQVINCQIIHLVKVTSPRRN